MIRVFYHIFCNEHTLGVVKDQVLKLHFSGLYAMCNVIHCFLAGPHTTAVSEYLRECGSKFMMCDVAPADMSGERLTLERIQHFVQDEDVFLYIHTKGVSRAAQTFADEKTRQEVLQRLEDWRNFMEYHLMVRHRSCMEALQTHDCAGVNWRFWDVPLENGTDSFSKTEHFRHFSGNMWWCTAKYWKTLPSKIGDDYLDPEMHIGKGNPRIKCLAESWVDHYKTRKPFNTFVDVV